MRTLLMRLEHVFEDGSRMHVEVRIDPLELEHNVIASYVLLEAYRMLMDHLHGIQDNSHIDLIVKEMARRPKKPTKGKRK